MQLVIAADTTALGAAADDLAGAFNSLPLGTALPPVGDPDADAALSEASAAFSRHAQALATASSQGARSLHGFRVGYITAGN